MTYFVFCSDLAPLRELREQELFPAIHVLARELLHPEEQLIAPKDSSFHSLWLHQLAQVPAARLYFPLAIASGAPQSGAPPPERCLPP